MGPNCLGLGFTPTKNTLNGNIYILCWQICGNKYKTLRDCMTVLVMDSKMSFVSCSLRKQFIASSRFPHEHHKFFCSVSIVYKDAILKNLPSLTFVKLTLPRNIIQIRVNYKIWRNSSRMNHSKIILIFTEISKAKKNKPQKAL